MKIYRIAKTEFCDNTGIGAKMYGGRWNLQGDAVLYGSSSIASALLERLTIDPELFAAKRYLLYSVMEFDCSEVLIFQPNVHDLPQGWDEIPPLRFSQEYGSGLIRKGKVCFAVPSVVDKTSLNFVVNPLAEDFKNIKIKIYPLMIDKRIVGH